MPEPLIPYTPPTEKSKFALGTRQLTEARLNKMWERVGYTKKVRLSHDDFVVLIGELTDAWEQIKRLTRALEDSHYDHANGCPWIGSLDAARREITDLIDARASDSL